MAKKLMIWKTKGMNRDLSVSAFNPEFAFENRNLRLMTNDNNTMLSWVNERGTEAVSLVSTTSGLSTSIQGKPIGTAVLNHKLILFTTAGPQNNRPDYIYMLENNSGQNIMGVTQLYNGNLKFSLDNPIETTVSYESDSIQKVYWTDNKNQPRLINIAKRYNTTDDDTQFDFVCTLQLKEEVSIEKKIGVSGMFAPGVIQYALTYYHRYGQESNIFYTSPLQYISYIDRGASPEDKVDNAFTITIKNVDTNFDYLRIYSIQRTSINATPICKRVHDFDISNLNPSGGIYSASFTDTGTSGDIIDPMELLYKGGDSIRVMTMEQKDNTLFMGNFSIIRQDLSVLKDFISEDCTVDSGKRTILISAGNASSSGDEYYKYGNQLTATAYSGGAVETVNYFNSQDGLKSVPCSGFKYGDYYRCGLQFQYETGKWSDPVFINNKNDVKVTTKPAVSELGLNGNNYCVDLPALKTTIDKDIVHQLLLANYKRARAVVVFPNIQDRVTLCQGVICPTLYTSKHRYNDKDIYAQSSWFFRPPVTTSQFSTNGTVKPTGGSKDEDEDWNPYLTYTDNQVLPGYPRTGETPYNPADIRAVEVQGYYDSENRFEIDRSFVTMHSPDVEFDTQLYSVNYDNTMWAKVGYANFVNTLSDIDIQTETPTASGDAAGFVHKSFANTLSYGIVAGLFYEDYIIDDNVQGEDEGISDKIEPWWAQKSPVKWMVYPWNKSGSLNNDFNRPADAGIPSAVLKKKVISNLRIARSSWINGTIQSQSFNTGYNPKLFSSNEATILRFGNNNYQGNVDTVLSPDEGEGQYLAFHGSDGNFDELKTTNMKTEFTDPINFKTFGMNLNGSDIQYGLWKYNGSGWSRFPIDAGEKLFGDRYLDVCVKRGDVRMKYKSSPHLVLAGSIGWRYDDELPIVEVRNPDTERFGGKSDDALKENIWVPCGEPVLLEEGKDATVWFSYGDTYYQRYDCLKTYPFTFEDPNQIVEIGSFMLETHVNIDGRYDRNRGQLSNINMSPQNFNLINPVYSQIDNFFTYRYHDDEYYKGRQYINQITWSKTKSSGADIDAYTNVTLASTLELDGDKGAINKLIKFNNDLLAFQDTGLSQILYNVNTVISTTQGVPVEIGNSDKVQGKNYISGTVGCTNKWSVVSTPSGIYFMDSHDKNIYMFNGKIENLSLQKGMNSWVKQNMPNLNNVWTPQGFESFVSYYDKLNQEVYFINDSTALTYSEKLGVFTSFYDYGNTPYFCNFESMGLWIRNPYKINNVEYPASIWRHNAGNYCSFFGTQHPFSMTLVGNPEPQMDKIFTNLEFRANVDGEGTVSGDDFTPYLPFNSLETWNEYQHGITTLNIRNGHDAFKHHDGSISSLKRKFRIWRCDIPRDNAELTLDSALGISRFAKHPIDRMRNPWIYLKLKKEAALAMKRTEVHDIELSYFD